MGASETVHNHDTCPVITLTFKGSTMPVCQHDLDRYAALYGELPKSLSEATAPSTPTEGEG